MDPHATGLCTDVLLEIGIIGYGLASQAVSSDAYVEEHISTKTRCMRVC